MSSHICHAVACERNVPPRMHMCKPHWSMVPRTLQRALWAAYKPGQERTMTPSVRYLHAAAECVRSVAEAEGQPQTAIDLDISTYLAWAEMIDEEHDDEGLR